MSRWTVLFSSVIPASGTRQIDKTFIKGFLTIRVQELCKSHNKRKLRQQYRKSHFSGDKTAPLAVRIFPMLADVGPNRKLVPSTPRLSFWAVWFRHNPPPPTPPRDFAQKAKSRGGTLVTRAYIKESTYSWNIQSYSQKRKNLDLLEQGPRGIGR